MRLYESTHKHGVAENVGNHPNSFFTSAQAFERATKKAENKQASSQVNTGAASEAEKKVADEKKDDVDMASAN